MEKNNRLRDMLLAAKAGNKAKAENAKPEVKVEGATTGSVTSVDGPAINSEQAASINTNGGNATDVSMMLAAPQAMQHGPVSSPPSSSGKAASTASVGGSCRASPAPSIGGLSERCSLLGCGAG